jgi:hypothetical protein
MGLAAHGAAPLPTLYDEYETIRRSVDFRPVINVK